MTDKQRNTEAWLGLKDSINSRHKSIDIFYHIDENNKVLGYYGISDTGVVETSIKCKVGEDIIVMNNRRSNDTRDGEIIKLQDKNYQLKSIILFGSISAVIVILIMLIALLYSYGA